MMYQGIDTAARITAAQARILRENGVSFVGRYLAPANYSKAVTDDEAKRIHDAGMGVLLIYETYATRCREGEAAGKRDGYEAYSLAKQMSVPDNTAIYFAVDYDAPKNDYVAIEKYLYAAKLACATYRCGVYGKADLINSIHADAYMQCVAWSNGMVSTKNNIYQYEWQGGAEAQAMAKAVGIPVDMCRSANLNAAGIWMPEQKKMWYDDAMAWTQQHGMIKDGRPNDTVTRAEMATVLMRYHALFGEEDSKNDSGLLS